MWSRICGGLASQIESTPELALFRLERARTVQADNHDQAGCGVLQQNGAYKEDLLDFVLVPSCTRLHERRSHRSYGPWARRSEKKVSQQGNREGTPL